MVGVEEVVNRFKGKGFEVIGVKIDVINVDDINVMVFEVVSYFGGLDLLVNNVGIFIFLKLKLFD